MLYLIECHKCHLEMPEHRVGPDGCANCNDEMAAQLQADIEWRERLYDYSH